MSDRGLVRPHNEDCLLVEPDRGLFAVADGMGGHAAGEVASRLAIEAVREVFEEIPEEGDEVIARIQAAIERANRNIAERILSQPECRGMGTTLVMCVTRDDRFWVAHVGDSRAYLLRGDAIRQLTTDHSFVNELVRLGMLSREEAARDPRRNVVTRALGSGAPVAPDIYEDRWRAGDRLLLCSDGLNTMVGDDEILRIVREAGDDVGRAVDELVAAALAGGGEDNVTVVLAAMVPRAETDEQDDQPEDTGVIEPPEPAERPLASPDGEDAPADC
ncbi:MAG: Stp1/IreP family PP2C-type Ser/Thr phosphatase [Acidobacteriota bacterium]